MGRHKPQIAKHFTLFRRCKTLTGEVGNDRLGVGVSGEMALKPQGIRKIGQVVPDVSSNKSRKNILAEGNAQALMMSG